MATAFNCVHHAAFCAQTPWDRSEGAGGSRPEFQYYSCFIYKSDAIENDGTTPGVWVLNRVASGYGPANIINQYERTGWFVACLVPIPYVPDAAWEASVSEAREKGIV